MDMNARGHTLRSEVVAWKKRIGMSKTNRLTTSYFGITREWYGWDSTLEEKLGATLALFKSIASASLPRLAFEPISRALRSSRDNSTHDTRIERGQRKANERKDETRTAHLVHLSSDIMPYLQDYSQNETRSCIVDDIWGQGEKSVTPKQEEHWMSFLFDSRQLFTMRSEHLWDTIV